MTVKVDRRLEALKELGAIIAEDYRRRLAEGTLGKPKRPQDQSENEYDFEVIANLHDPDCYGLYTETVRVENFLRNRKNHAKKLLLRKKATETMSNEK